MGSAAEAEDAAQAVFLSLVEHPRVFNDAEHEKAWLIACVQNRSRDVLRSARVSRRAEMPDEVPDERRPSIGEAFEAVLPSSPSLRFPLMRTRPPMPTCAAS